MITETALDLLIRNKKKILVLAVVLLLALIGYAVYTAVGRVGKVAVGLHVVPSDATITLNGKKVGFNMGTVYLSQGTYDVSVEKTGFAAHKETLTFDNDHTLLVASLDPQSDTATKWANSHQDAYSANEKYAGQKAHQDGESFFKKNPLARQLPIKDPYYTIGYTTNHDGTINVTIETPSPRYRFFAVKMIRSLGYDPSDYHVIFKDYSNPLTDQNERGE